jgi:hypothetical protein
MDYLYKFEFRPALARQPEADFDKVEAAKTSFKSTIEL